MQTTKFIRVHFSDVENTKYSHSDLWGVCIRNFSFVSPSSNNTAPYFKDYQCTGMQDKSGMDIYFDIDIVKITGYEYRIPCGVGFYTCTADILFIVESSFFGPKLRLINPPDGLTILTPAVIFNRNGTYSHLNYPARMVVVGNIYDHPELLK